MSLYVIQRIDDGKYVAKPGSPHSHTRRYEQIRFFASREAAEQAGVCGNERVIAVVGEARKP